MPLKRAINHHTIGFVLIKRQEAIPIMGQIFHISGFNIKYEHIIIGGKHIKMPRVGGGNIALPIASKFLLYFFEKCIGQLNKTVCFYCNRAANPKL